MKTHTRNSQHLRHINIQSIYGHPINNQLIDILSSALEAADPYKIIMDSVNLNNGKLSICGKDYILATFKTIFVVGIGKASYLMSLALSDIMEHYISHGMIITKYGHLGTQDILPSFAKYEAGHPIPDENGVSATRALLSLLQTATKEDLIIFLISGGGSALLTSPAGNLSLEDIKCVTELLISSGSSIDEINCVRKHIENIKGGRLAKATMAGQMISLILSDVIGNRIDVIASGPTTGDPTSFYDSHTILQRYNLLDRIPFTVKAWIQRGLNGEIEDTPKPIDKVWSDIDHYVIGSNVIAADAALTAAKMCGFNSTLVAGNLIGEARQAGAFLCGLAKQVDQIGRPVSRPACLIAGGETTVTLSKGGLGGRNQEVALASVEALNSIPDVVLATFSTDGGDGPTDAAGAVVTSDTFSRAKALGMNTDAYLANHDSYHYFDKLGDLIKTGPTGTNVNDLSLLFIL